MGSNPTLSAIFITSYDAKRHLFQLRQLQGCKAMSSRLPGNDADANPEMELALCWFDREQWQLLKGLDPDGTDDTYEDWRRQASEAVDMLRSSGTRVRKIHVRVAELVAWCEERGLKPDSSARAEYAAFLAQSRRKGKKKP